MLVRSYRTVSPLPSSHQAQTAVCFLWHCPASHLGLPLAITLLCEVRTFLETFRSRGRPANSSARTTISAGQSAATSESSTTTAPYARSTCLSQRGPSRRVRTAARPSPNTTITGTVMAQADHTFCGPYTSSAAAGPSDQSPEVASEFAHGVGQDLDRLDAAPQQAQTGGHQQHRLRDQSDVEPVFDHLVPSDQCVRRRTIRLSRKTAASPVGPIASRSTVPTCCGCQPSSGRSSSATTSSAD